MTNEPVDISVSPDPAAPDDEVTVTVTAREPVEFRDTNQIYILREIDGQEIVLNSTAAMMMVVPMEAGEEYQESFVPKDLIGNHTLPRDSPVRSVEGEYIALARVVSNPVKEPFQVKA